MTTPKSTWFTVEQKRALVDFWTVYVAHFDAINAEVVRVRRAHPDFAPWLRKRTATERPAVRDWRPIFERALETWDWTEYEAGLLREGDEFAQLGVSFSAWSDVTRSLQQQFTRLLVAAYGHDLPRLTDALVVMQEFLGRRAAVLGDAFMHAERAAEDRFRALLEAAPDAMVIIDGAGRITLVNAQAEKLFGAPRTELVSQPAEQLLPERFRPAYRQLGADYLRAPHPARTVGADNALFALRADGVEIPVEVSLSPLTTKEGLVVCAVVRDITERQRAAAALVDTNRELEAFSYSVAHDLRAPLRGMHGFAQILAEEHGDQLDEKGHALIDDIRRGAVRMAEIIDALLSLARVSRAPLHTQDVDLSKLARTVLAGLADGEPRPGMTIIIEDGMTAFMDPALAQRLLDNLLSNAYKFTAKVPAPRIELGRVPDDAAAFFVRDNGAGFNMDYAAKLFQPFGRLHTAGEFAGDGIGLATVQRILQRHHGRIWVDARENGGACFYFAVPPAP